MGHIVIRWLPYGLVFMSAKGPYSLISDRCGSSRENRVNQSGSVRLSAEEVRGPPQRNLLIITTNQGVVGSSPAGRAIFQKTWQRKPSPPSCRGTNVGPFIPAVACRSCGSKPGPPRVGAERASLHAQARLIFRGERRVAPFGFRSDSEVSWPA